MNAHIVENVSFSLLLLLLLSLSPLPLVESLVMMTPFCLFRSCGATETSGRSDDDRNLLAVPTTSSPKEKDDANALALKRALRSWFLDTRVSPGLKRELLWVDPRDHDRSRLCDDDEEEEEEDVAKATKSSRSDRSNANDEGDGEDVSSFVVAVGVPDRPLYRELARRVARLYDERSSSPTTLLHLLPAERLGFVESTSASERRRRFVAPTGPPPSTPRDFARVLAAGGGDDLVRDLLGLRCTAGTVRNVLFPSRARLVEAADRRHRVATNGPTTDDTVAARARAKHAGRCRVADGGFFGVVRGSARERNAAARGLVRTLLERAVWINVHRFGGCGDDPVLEIRAASGHGARWSGDWTTTGRGGPTDAVFRGFLEPHMEDGHERKWRY